MISAVQGCFSGSIFPETSRFLDLVVIILQLLTRNTTRILSRSPSHSYKSNFPRRAPIVVTAKK